MSEGTALSAVQSLSNYPSEMDRQRPLQPYAIPQHDQPQDIQHHAQYQQYSHDNQFRYAAPTPSFHAPTMAGRYEPPRELPAPLPSMIPGQPQGGYGPPMEMSVDTTGQAPPPGVKPRVTATLWEDEGTLCFQVDVKGTCVARREDNHYINGTKLLNVVGMTRGRRDGILKSEKIKHVVKIGPMHLKGVWIPFERALEFANKEKITELLYPLFVHNISALLHHPVNHHPAYRTSSATSANMYPPTPTSAHIPRTHDYAPLTPLSPPDYGRGMSQAEYERDRQQGGPGGNMGHFQSDQVNEGPRPLYS